MVTQAMRQPGIGPRANAHQQTAGDGEHQPTHGNCPGQAEGVEMSKTTRVFNGHADEADQYAEGPMQGMGQAVGGIQGGLKSFHVRNYGQRRD